MKLFVGIFVSALAAGSVMAQDAPQPAPPPAQVVQVPGLTYKVAADPASTYKILAETVAGQTSGVKNAPFSAEEVNESVQTLADGNRIVHNSTGKMYRNSEGRMRRESHGGPFNSVGFAYNLTPGVSIVDPLIRQKIELDSTLKTARVYDLKAGQELTAAKLTAEKANEELLTKLKADGKLDKFQIVPDNVVGVARPLTVTGVNTEGFTGVFNVAAKSRYETKSEDLGSRDFEGVTAEGTRRTTIIPAGAIGNERPIETVYERWFSKDLGVVVYSKTIDPRTGEQTYKLTNVVRAEPDPSLFNVPMEYKTLDDHGVVIRATPARPAIAPKAITPAPAVARP